MYSYKGKKILVLGMGVSGQGVAKTLSLLGANVIINDKKHIKETNKKIDELKSLGVTIITGCQDESLLVDIDRVVVSPGISPNINLLEIAKSRGITVVSEVEVAYDICKAPILAITGTNGKTTTTMLLGTVLKACCKKVVIGGNIGKSLSEQAQKTSQDSYLVAELSSYQLETILDFSPKGAIFLNLAPDHLHRHKTMENYMDAKANIFKNQKSDDFMVFNIDDRKVASLAERCNSNKLWISLKEKVSDGAYFDGNMLYAVKQGVSIPVIQRSEITLRGNHNIENVLAVIALVYALGEPIELIREGIKNFSPVKHRLEPVAINNGVIYINDSKATNTDSVLKALNSYHEPIILILGGHDKGENFSNFMIEVQKRSKFIIIMGEVSDRLIYEAETLGMKNYTKADSMIEAVKIANNYAEKGDVVLLSPACSSFDWYKSFEERGEDFKHAVEIMIGGKT